MSDPTRDSAIQAMKKKCIRITRDVLRLSVQFSFGDMPDNFLPCDFILTACYDYVPRSVFAMESTVRNKCFFVLFYCFNQLLSIAF
jgi:hypothetical protein